jgi:hypothetical protein
MTTTTTWALHHATPSAHHTEVGTANSAANARHALLDATRAAIAAAAADSCPRYTLRINDELVAIIATGLDEDGQPDHTEAIYFVDQLDKPRDPYRH